MKKVPGVIILGNEYQALGLLRQLAVLGIPCVLVDQDNWGPAMFSRFRTQFHHSPAYHSPQFWPWLLELAHSKSYVGWVVIPTDDEQLRQLAEHFDEVRSFFRYAGMPWECYQHVYNKRLAHYFVTTLSIPVPKTYIPEHRDDVPQVRDMEFPLVIKPAFKREYSKYTRKKAFLAESPEHVRKILNGPLQKVPADQLLYQEFVRGGGDNQWSFAGLFVDGEPVAAFTACRRRQKPPDFGRASTFVVALHDEEVESQSLKVLASLKYTGLAEVEWKRDAKDGKLKFLETNARCWGWHNLASRVVGNLPKMLYDFLVYGTVQKTEPIYGAKWIKWVTDIPVCLHEWKRRELCLKEYIDGLRGDVISCEWDKSDPLPFLLQFALIPYLILKRGY